MRLARTAFALDEIQAFLGERFDSPLVESYLVQYLLVAFYSEIEERVKDIIGARIADIGDRKVAHFIARTNEQMLKRVKKAEINDVLQKFGCGEGDVLSTILGDINLQPYFDVITNRHLVSHQGGTNMTLIQVAAALPVAEAVLNAMAEALTADETTPGSSENVRRRTLATGEQSRIFHRIYRWMMTRSSGKFN